MTEERVKKGSVLRFFMGVEHILFDDVQGKVQPSVFGEVLKLEAQEALALHNQKILGGKLEEGLSLCEERTTLIDTSILDFFGEFMHPMITGRYAYAAIGGYGRAQMNPRSDLDFVLFMEDFPGNRDFLKFYTSNIDDFTRLIHNQNFCTVFTHAPEHLFDLDMERVSAYLEMRFLIGDQEFMQQTLDFLRKRYLKGEIVMDGEEHPPTPFDFLFSKRTDHQKDREHHPESIGTVGTFNIKNGIGGLRELHTALWIEQMYDGYSTAELYHHLPDDVKTAFSVLLQTRSWFHLHKPHTPYVDTMHQSDFTAFIEHFGPDSLYRLIEARRVITRYSNKLMTERYRHGTEVKDGIIWTDDGFSFAPYAVLRDKTDNFCDIMLESQRRKEHIEERTFTMLQEEAKERLHHSPRFFEFFETSGDLSETIRRFMSMSVVDKLLPGFEGLVGLMYVGNHRASELTKATRARERVKNLDDLLNHEWGKELPFRNLILQSQVSKEGYLALRFALAYKEGASLDLLEQHFPQFSRVRGRVQYMIENKRMLFNIAQFDPVEDDVVIDGFRDKINDREQLDMMLLYTCADLDYGKKNRFEQHQWNRVFSLVEAVRNRFDGMDPVGKLLSEFEGRASNENYPEIARALPSAFLRSRRIADWNQLNAYTCGLLHVFQKHEPIVDVLAENGQDQTVRIFSDDYKGLLWRIVGVCYEKGAAIKQTEIYSLREPFPLALDFITVAVPNPTGLAEVHAEKLEAFAAELRQALEQVVTEKTELAEPSYECLKETAIKIEYLPDIDSFRMFVRGKPNSSALYTATRLLSERVGADIFSTSVYNHRNKEVTDTIVFTVPIERRPLISETFQTEVLEKIL